MKSLLLVSLAIISCYGQRDSTRTTTRQPLAAIGGIVGGIGNDSPSKPRYNDLAWHPATAAVNNFLRNQNRAATQAYVPFKVLKASVQIVSGLLYTLDIEMAESTCIITRNANSANYIAHKCPLTGKGEHQVFRVEIVHQPWMERLDVLSVSRVEQEKPKDIPAPQPEKVAPGLNPGKLIHATRKPAANLIQGPQTTRKTIVARDSQPKIAPVWDSQPVTKMVPSPQFVPRPQPGKLIQVPKPRVQKFEGFPIRH